MEHAGPETLVLLDELGAGTDPTEGSALAQALLDHFIRSGALVAATTHYAEIKVYAHETPAARNASVEFDLETLSPTYRLTIGLPGGSQAFAIAERLGLPDAIVADARSRLSENQRAFEATLASIRHQEGEIAGAVERARVAEAKASDALRAADEERRKARRERDEAVRTAREEAERLVESLRDDVAGVRRRLERETVTAPAIDAALARAEQTLERLADPVAAQPEQRAPVDPAHLAARRAGEEPQRRLGGTDRGAREGRHPGHARGGRHARLGGRRRPRGRRGQRGLRYRERSLRRTRPVVGDRPGSPTRPEAGSGISSLMLARARTVASSLDLRGARVDEALDALGRYLDDASLAGLEQVLIIHGLGTGALRDAVRSQAATHPLVKSFRAGERGEGGDGATIVKL